MRCFFDSPACGGTVEPARGKEGVAWLNDSPVIDHGAGYCEAHMSTAIESYRWNPIDSKQKGARAE